MAEARVALPARIVNRYSITWGDHVARPCRHLVTTIVWLVSAPISMFVNQKVVRNPYTFAEAKKG
jgi:hypothetical protein